MHSTLSTTSSQPPDQQRNSRSRTSNPCAVDFDLNCNAGMVYLQLAGEEGHIIGVFQLDRVGTSSDWQVTLNLRPARYRYRYHVLWRDGVTTICGRDEGQGRSRINGLDITFSVPPAATAEAPELDDTDAATGSCERRAVLAAVN